MKKVISLILVICMIFSLCLPVLATDAASVAIAVGDGQTKISSDKYISYEGAGSLEPVYTTNSFTYRLNFSNSGHYRLSIRNLNFNDTTEDTVARISVDGKEVGSGIIPKEAVPGQSNSVQESYICSFDVDAGEKLLTVYNAGAAFYFYGVILEQVEIREEYNISANDYSAVSDTGVTDNLPDTGMSPNSYAEYNITADCDGTYGVYAMVAAELGTDGVISASFDSVSAGNGTFTGSDWYEFKEVYIGAVSLKEGEHTLRMTAGAVMRLRSIRIKAVAKDTEAAFLKELQEADSALSLQSLFKEYNDSMIIPYDSYMNKIFYRRLVEEELLKTAYDSLIEFDSLFLTLYNEEKNNPLVTVTQNGESVATLVNGEFTVTIAPRFMEELMAIAAVYTDDGMTLIDSKKADVVPYESATITGLSATDDGKLLKVFFIKDTNTLRPMELPLIQSRIYVAVDGNDNNEGTIDKPIKTLEKAIAKTKELNAIHQRDIVICLAGGEYEIEDTIELDEAFSGRDDCGVHFKSLVPSNPAIISGGYDVEEWSDADGDGIYTAQLPNTITDVRQLYIDEEPAQRARGNYLFRAKSYWDDTNTSYEEDGVLTVTFDTTKLDGSTLTNDNISLCKFGTEENLLDESATISNQDGIVSISGLNFEDGNYKLTLGENIANSFGVKSGTEDYFRFVVGTPQPENFNPQIDTDGTTAVLTFDCEISDIAGNVEDNVTVIGGNGTANISLNSENKKQILITGVTDAINIKVSGDILSAAGNKMGTDFETGCYIPVCSIDSAAAYYDKESDEYIAHVVLKPNCMENVDVQVWAGLYDTSNDTNVLVAYDGLPNKTVTSISSGSNTMNNIKFSAEKYKDKFDTIKIFVWSQGTYIPLDECIKKVAPVVPEE